MTTDIDAIRKREQAADSGPWRVVEEHGRDIADEAYSRITIQTAIRYGESCEIAELVDPDHDWASKLTEENAEFIAHARTDIPALLAELDKVRAQLADTHNRAHTDATNLQQILRDKTALANENARLREQVCLIVTCSDCGEALKWDGGTPHFRNLDEAKDILDDEGWRLIDGNPMCGDCCHYAPHRFKPERPGGLTCERCDLEEDDHEAATEKAEVAR